MKTKTLAIYIVLLLTGETIACKAAFDIGQTINRLGISKPDIRTR